MANVSNTDTIDSIILLVELNQDVELSKAKRQLPFFQSTCDTDVTIQLYFKHVGQNVAVKMMQSVGKIYLQFKKQYTFIDLHHAYHIAKDIRLIPSLENRRLLTFFTGRIREN
jgi:hypothetical protein